MTVVFFSRLFYPHIGGVEKHVMALSTRLVKKRHRVIVITEMPEVSYNLKNHSVGDSANITERVSGISIYRIPVGKSEWLKKFQIWWWLYQHRDLFLDTDIIHCHDVFYWFLPFRLCYPGKKVFTTFHGYEGNRKPRLKAIMMHRLAEKLSIGTIAIGNVIDRYYKTTSNLVLYGGVEKVIKIGNLSHYKREKIHVLYFGRLEDEVGILYYLQALVKLQNKGYKIRMIVLGNGSQEEAAKTYVSKHRLDVKFHSFSENVDLYLEKCDVVFASRYLSILEAFAYRKFVIAIYNNKIKKDYLTMTPFAEYIAIAKDPDDVMKSFLKFVNRKSQISPKIDEAYSWVKKQTWDAVLESYFQLWKVKK